MADDTHTIQAIKTVGIYHGLPTFPQSNEPFSALVVGASGISGQHMIRVLSQSPQRWTKIHALSRSPRNIPATIASLVTHVPIDLLKSPEEIARKLIDGDVKASDLPPTTITFISNVFSETIFSSPPTSNHRLHPESLCGQTATN